jgi:uncharacterized protein (DUF1778 family)
MTARASTSVRLHPKEKKLIDQAAQTIGGDLRSFIRIAAMEKAETVLADAAYRHYMEETVRRSLERSKTEPSISHAEVMRQAKERIGQMRAKKKK